MMLRSLYLKRAINWFLRDHGENNKRLRSLILTPSEWDSVELLCGILLPFKVFSQRHESTSRPRIAEVFWTYENLFNELDELKSSVDEAIEQGKEWATNLEEALEAVTEKLQDYYGRTSHPFVYGDATILDPFMKEVVFMQEGLSGKDGHDWKRIYETACRQRYVAKYERKSQDTDTGSLVVSNGAVLPPVFESRKRKAEEIVEKRLGGLQDAIQGALKKRAKTNEFDRYIKADTIELASGSRDGLGWWKTNWKMCPNLSKMFRTSHAVPATSAGVERIFSMSGRMARTDRGKLSFDTISQSMQYKNYLQRKEKSFSQLEEQCIDDESEDEGIEDERLSAEEEKLQEDIRKHFLYKTSNLAGDKDEEDLYGPQPSSV
jgi:hAT family C-terminal dimerisation region